MPMDFPDELLEKHAKIVGFRPRNKNENIGEYREALANYMEPIDFIESQEIRNGKGWNRWDDEEGRDVVMRAFGWNRFSKQTQKKPK